MSDFSREARAYCRQHRVYFYPNDAGCEQCERDIENIADEGPSENCVCDIEKGEGLDVICDNFALNMVTVTVDYRSCFKCGHLEGCHENT